LTLETLPDPLVIGEEAEVTIATGRQRACVVPVTSLLSRQEGAGVLKVAQGRLIFQPVTVGISDGTRVAVLAGLEEGDLVAVQPGTLKPGGRVRPVPAAPEGKGG